VEIIMNEINEDLTNTQMRTRRDYFQEVDGRQQLAERELKYLESQLHISMSDVSSYAQLVVILSHRFFFSSFFGTRKEIELLVTRYIDEEDILSFEEVIGLIDQRHLV